jgi:hypothetical protein
MPKSPISDDSSTVGGDLWEVQDILAQRLTLSGEIEYLVVWRSTWTAADLVKDGPVLRHWHEAAKFKTGGSMAITLPVVRGTQLFSDCRQICLKWAALGGATDSRSVLGAVCALPDVPADVLNANPVVGPRKQLGSTAKRVRREVGCVSLLLLCGSPCCIGSCVENISQCVQ